jgi:hypothetical protein
MLNYMKNAKSYGKATAKWDMLGRNVQERERK